MPYRLYPPPSTGDVNLDSWNMRHWDMTEEMSEEIRTQSFSSLTSTEHAASHYSGGSDALDLSQLSGILDASQVSGSATLNSLLVGDLTANGFVGFGSGIFLGAPITWEGSTAPFLQNLPTGSQEVPNLNADKVDGYDAIALLDLDNATGTLNAAQIAGNAVLSNVHADLITSASEVRAVTVGVYNDPDFDVNPTVSFQGGVARIIFGAGGAPDTLVGRSAAGQFSGIAGTLILADRLGGQDSAYHLSLNNATGTLSANSVSGLSSVATTGDAAHLSGILGDSQLSVNIPRIGSMQTWTGQQVFTRNGINNVHATTSVTDSRVEYKVTTTRRGMIAWSNTIFQVLPDGVGLVLGGSGSSVGVYGATPVTRASAIAAPTGGATIDAEARTAIDLIRSAISRFGITF